MTPADQQQAAVGCCERIRLSASLQRQTLDLLEEIAVTDNCTAGRNPAAARDTLPLSGSRTSRRSNAARRCTSTCTGCAIRG